MASIRIPFSEEMAFACVIGRKHCTTRTEICGDVGDTFFVKYQDDLCLFEITHVEKRELGFVSEYLFKAEGFEKPGDFVRCWNKLHPRRGFSPIDIRFVHWFRGVEDFSVSDMEMVE